VSPEGAGGPHAATAPDATACAAGKRVCQLGDHHGALTTCWPPFVAPPAHPTDIDWWRTGVIPPAGTYDKYWPDPYTLFTIEVVAMQFAELKRLQDFRYPGSQGKQYFLGLEKVFEGSGNPAYPGGPFFNLFNLGERAAGAAAGAARWGKQPRRRGAPAGAAASA
jgi:hypothetical protein